MICKYIAVMAVTTYLIRVLPLTVFKKPIKNRFVRSVLFYIPCACLTAMTFPGFLFVTENVMSGIFGLAVSLIIAYKVDNLMIVAVGSAISVLAVELIYLI